jgi:Cof subfamily protein (haloacid dehalogenase superfamily)
MTYKQPIRMAALDLDGTLLNDQLELTPVVVHAFNRAVQAKLVVVVITGRDKLSALTFLKQLGSEHTVITSGGAQVWLNDELISHTSFTLQETRDILAIGLQYEAGMYVDQPQQTWRYGSRYYTDLYGHLSDSIEIDCGDKLLDPPPFKISLIQESSVLKSIRAQLTARYPSFTITFPFHQVLDVNPEGGNKGAALTCLASLLGISLSQIAVVGDSENDLSMFAVAGLTYAMGNAVDSLRTCADWIAPTNDEDGVAWVLGEIMKRNGER